MLKKQVLDQENESHYKFSTGKYFSLGWRLLFKKFFSLFTFSVLVGLIQLASYVFGYYWAFMFSLFVIPSLWAGMYLSADAIRRDDFFPFDQYTGGFNYAVSLGLSRIMIGLVFFVISLPILLLAVPFEYFLQNIIHVPTFELSTKTYTIIGVFMILLYLYLYIALFFVDQFILFKQQNYWQAIKNSIKSITRHWHFFFLVGLISFIFYLIICSVAIPIYLSIVMKSELGYTWSTGGLVYLKEEPIRFLRQFTGLHYMFLFITVFVNPLQFCVLHSAFADMFNLPKATDYTIETEN